MSNDDIIKALQHCSADVNCKECPANDFTRDCIKVITRSALELIDRQKARIKELQAELEIIANVIERKDNEIERYKGVIRILENDVKTERSEYVKEFAKALIDKVNGGAIGDCSEVADFAAEFLEQYIYNPMRCCECKHYLPINDRGLSGICCKTHISFGERDERIDEHVHYCALAERKDIDDT